MISSEDVGRSPGPPSLSRVISFQKTSNCMVFTAFCVEVPAYANKPEASAGATPYSADHARVAATAVDEELPAQF